MNDTKIEPWTEADTARAEQDVDAYGAIMSPEGYRIIAEVKRRAAEIERLKGELANHKALLAAAESAGRAVCDELDTARAELHACGLELQTCRATLEEERRDGDTQRTEIERLTAELDHRAKKLDEWQVSSDRFRLKAPRRRACWPIQGHARLARSQKAEIERLTAELAGVRASYQARETEWREGRVVLDPSERPPAAASLEARAKIAMLAHDASPPAVFGGPWENAAPECHAAWIAVVRAVDASRPGLMCAECHRSVGRDVAHIDCEAPELGLVSDEHGYRAGSVDSAVATVVRAMGRPGLTEEEALATAGPLSRDIYNRIGLATGNKIGAPEWMRDIIAAALLRASRGDHLFERGGELLRAILEKLTKAAASDPDAREARWAAERILQRATLAAEPARTDPEAARRLAEARPGLTEEEARSSRAHAARQAAYHACIGDEPARVDAGWRAFEKALGAPGDVAIPRAILERLAKAAASDPDARWAAERILQRATLAAEPARTDPEAARRLAERHFLIIGPALGEVIGCTPSQGMPSPREVGEPGATFREVSAEACPLCAVVGGAK